MQAYVELKRDWLPDKGSIERPWIAVLEGKREKHVNGSVEAAERIPVFAISCTLKRSYSTDKELNSQVIKITMVIWYQQASFIGFLSISTINTWR